MRGFRGAAHPAKWGQAEPSEAARVICARFVEPARAADRSTAATAPISAPREFATTSRGSIVRSARRSRCTSSAPTLIAAASRPARQDAEHGGPAIDGQRPEHAERQEQRRVAHELEHRVARPGRDPESPEEIEHGVEPEEAAVAVDVHGPEEHDRDRRGIEHGGGGEPPASSGTGVHGCLSDHVASHDAPSAPRDRMESSGQASRRAFRPGFPEVSASSRDGPEAPESGDRRDPDLSRVRNAG